MAAVLLATTVVPAAQRRRADNSVHGAPVATTTIAADPDAFYGKVVTVSAAVDRVLSPTAFVVDQRRATGPKQVSPAGKPLLVIAPRLAAALAQGRYFLIRGEVSRFDPEAIAAAVPGFAHGLPEEAAAAFRGVPVLVAASVVDSTYVDLVKPPESTAGGSEAGEGAAAEGR